MNLPSRRYTHSDAEKLEALAQLAEKMLSKHTATLAEFLAGLRYGMSRDKWEEAQEQARVLLDAYANYSGMDPEKVEYMYGA